jgi:hypothetical protein
MPNGKPYDHPITDILFYKLTAFSPAVDVLIAEIIKLGGQAEVEARFNLFQPPPLERFESDLRVMRDRLHREAKERGWEVE